MRLTNVFRFNYFYCYWGCVYPLGDNYSIWKTEKNMTLIQVIFCTAEWQKGHCMVKGKKHGGNWNKSALSLATQQNLRLMGSGRHLSCLRPHPSNTSCFAALSTAGGWGAARRWSPPPHPNAEASPGRERPTQHFPIIASQSANYHPLLRSKNHDDPIFKW